MNLEQTERITCPSCERGIEVVLAIEESDGGVCIWTKETRLAPGIANKVKLLRQSHGWTLTTLAQKTGIDLSYLSKIGKGRKEVGLKTLHKLAAAFGVTVSYLMEGIE